MKKKMIVIGLLVVFMMLTISFSTAVSTNGANTSKKESPLYRLRTTRATREKINVIIDNIKTRFFGERMFFIPIPWLRTEIDPYPAESTTPWKVCRRTLKYGPGYCCSTMANNL